MVFLVLWKSSGNQFARSKRRSTQFLIFLKFLAFGKILNPPLRENDCFSYAFHMTVAGAVIVNYCFEFRYKSNGIFVLGVVFFSSDKLRLFN